MVRGALNVGLATQGIDTAAGNSHVAQKQLDHGHGPNILDTYGVLGPAHSVHDGTGLALLARGRIGLVDLFQVRPGCTRNSRDLLDIIAGKVFLQLLEHAARILEAVVSLGNTLFVLVKGPLRLIVRPGLLVVAGKKPILEAELFAQDEAGVGVIRHILLVIQVVADDVVDHPTQKSDVGP